MTTPTILPRPTPLGHLPHRGLMCPNLEAVPILWRVTAWSVNDAGLARPRLEAGVTTFTHEEALQRTVAQAREESGHVMPPGEWESWAWTVSRWSEVPAEPVERWDVRHCPCGATFPATLGKYGCPNCLGDEAAP